MRVTMRAPAPTQSEPKTGGTSGLLRKEREVTPWMEARAAVSPMVPTYPMRRTPVPLYPSGRPPADRGFPTLMEVPATTGAWREDPARDVEPAVSSRSPSGQPSHAGGPVFPPA